MKCEACNEEIEGTIGKILISYEMADGGGQDLLGNFCTTCYKRIVQAQLDEIRTIWAERNK